MTPKAGATPRPTPEAAPQTEPTDAPVGSSHNGVLGDFRKAYPDSIHLKDAVRFKARKEDDNDQTRTGVLEGLLLKCIGQTHTERLFEADLIVIDSAGKRFKLTGKLTSEHLLGKDPQQAQTDGPVTKEQGHGGTSSRS